MDNRRFWTTRYSIINALYFAAFCGIHMYAAVYLLSKGFSNTQIGITLALANITSVIFQPFIAGMIDRPGKFSNRNVSIVITTLILFFSVVLYFLQDQKIMIFAAYAIIYMMQMAYQPLIIALNFEYEKYGCKINFGLARGIGSAGFALFSALIGNLLTQYGLSSLHIANSVILFLLLLFLIGFVPPKKDMIGERRELGESHDNFFAFLKHYPQFMLFLVGTVCLFFAHNMINDFLIQIIQPLGGSERELGYAVSLAAILELPTMALFVYISKKYGCFRILVFSAFFFSVKTVILLLANHISLVYVSSACQMAAYALYIPGSAYLVNMLMEDMDQVKGQAYVNCAITLGGVFSNVICGRILDVLHVSAMLIVGTFVCIIGTAITYISLKRAQNRMNLFASDSCKM